MTIKLQHIYIPKADQLLYEKCELLELKNQRSFINKLIRTLNATYLQKATDEGNLCFVNNKEVRAEYKTVFTSTDITHFVFAMLKKDTIDIELDDILLPIDLTGFWESVEKGKKIKNK